jgi:cyclophilin family peptidyl-prolyl cis-trans isomerase
VLGIADAGKDTGSCQWFIALPQPHLDGCHTVFGRVTNGWTWSELDQADTFDVKIVE